MGMRYDRDVNTTNGLGLQSMCSRINRILLPQSGSEEKLCGPRATSSVVKRSNAPGAINKFATTASLEMNTGIQTIRRPSRRDLPSQYAFVLAESPMEADNV